MSAAWGSDLLRRLEAGAGGTDADGARRGGRARAGLLRACTGALDAVQVVAAGVLTAMAVPGIADAIGVPQALGVSVLAALVSTAMRRSLRRGGGGGTLSPEALSEGALRGAAAVAVAVAVMTMCATLLIATPAAALAWLAAWLLVSVPASVALRLGTAFLATRVEGAALGVAVVGSPERSRSFAEAVTAARASGWQLAAEMGAETEGELARLREMVAEGRIDIVVLAMGGDDYDRIHAVCDALADSPVRICLGLDVEGLADLPLATPWRGGLPVVDLITDPHGGVRGALKRASDIVLALAALLVLSPAFAAVALAIRLESPGPALFRQRRFGIGNEPIEVLKFRTMRADQADPTGERRTEARDPRVTAVGRVLRRTSIDELPQLLNVLRGDMSLVGPRPHALHMRVGGAFYFDAVDRYRVRHRIKPGITGWAQVNGSRGEIDTMEKARRRVELDLWYIQNWSLTLDARILLRTALGGFATLKAD
jgi:exopolysaccharide biosynthesis polyprenyl glycosylphosphotransferase